MVVNGDIGEMMRGEGEDNTVVAALRRCLMAAGGVYSCCRWLLV